jgi:hypothetical protein
MISQAVRDFPRFVASRYSDDSYLMALALAEKLHNQG